MNAPSVEAYLGLGSNQGDRLAELRRAVTALAGVPGVAVVAVSDVWETEHVGDPGDQQDPYLNACVGIRTGLEPEELLRALKALEAAAGRPAGGHRRPRPLDLDILLFGDRVLAGERLRVPHPELARRAFVLEPLAQIAAGVRCPDSGETIAEARAKIRRKGGPWVRPYGGGGLRDAGPGSEQGGPGCCPGATSSSKA
jgi:2-amino-4-hydroxy-6-hydroxymethyldihydropteridine diphosphokinase